MTISHDMPDAEYRALPGLSQSALKALARSPAHFREAQDHPIEPTEAMQLGRIIHHLALTPGIAPFWSVRPEGMDGRTKEGKAWAEANAGSVIIKPDAAMRCTGTVAAVLSHPAWPGGGDAEVSITGELDGVQVKGRLDLLAGSTVCDIKTTQDARPEAFQRTFYTLKYHVQAAFYCDLAGVEDFVFVAVETEPPFACAAYRMNKAALDAGREEYRRLLALWRRCMDSGEWPGYSAAIHNLDLPAWA